MSNYTELVNETKETMGRQEWLPASLAIRLTDAVSELETENTRAVSELAEAEERIEGLKLMVKGYAHKAEVRGEIIERAKAAWVKAVPGGWDEMLELGAAIKGESADLTSGAENGTVES